MQEGQLTAFDGEVYKMKDYGKTADKNKTQRANRAEKKKKSEKEVKALKRENEKLQAALAKGRVPQVEDKRGTGNEIDAEHNQLYRAKTTPKTTPIKQRFGKEEQQRAKAAFGRTLASGLGIKDRLGETRSEKELKINFIDKNNNYSGNKRHREQPIEEDEYGWHYAEEEEEEHNFIDAKVAELRRGSVDEDEDQDVYAHSA